MGNFCSYQERTKINRNLFSDTHTFALMNDGNILTPERAWQDFFTWVKQQPEWGNSKKITRDEKQYIDKTNRQMARGTVKDKRLQKMFNKYAPGRYEFQGGFIIHEDKPTP